MGKKPVCLIIDDKPGELKYLEKMLLVDYKVVFAKDLEEAISNYKHGIAIALVDMNLIEYTQDSKLALGLLHSLKEHNVPAIAITNATDEVTVRDAFYKGDVHYFWFKAKDSLSDLLNAIKAVTNKSNLNTMINQQLQINSTHTGRNDNLLIKQVFMYVLALTTLLVVSFCTIGLLTWSVSKIVHESLIQNLIITIVASGIVLFILTIGGFGLLLKRITGKQFGEIAIEILHIIRPQPS